MRLKEKRLVLSVMLAGLLIPFVLQTNLYPFFRYSMFAEPVRRQIQQERFAVRMMMKTGETVLLNPLTIGIHQSTFDYLLRNHHYRGQQQELLKKLWELWPQDQPLQSFQLIRIVEQDTIQIDSLSVPHAQFGIRKVKELKTE